MVEVSAVEWRWQTDDQSLDCQTCEYSKNFRADLAYVPSHCCRLSLLLPAKHYLSDLGRYLRRIAHLSNNLTVDLSQVKSPNILVMLDRLHMPECTFCISCLISPASQLPMLGVLQQMALEFRREKRARGHAFVKDCVCMS